MTVVQNTQENGLLKASDALNNNKILNLQEQVLDVFQRKGYDEARESRGNLNSLKFNLNKIFEETSLEAKDLNSRQQNQISDCTAEVNRLEAGNENLKNENNTT